MKIEIMNKYLYIFDDRGKKLAYFEHFDDRGKQLAYFEHFEGSENKKTIIEICSQGAKGDLFIKNNNEKLQLAEVYWFSKKKLIYRVMFIDSKESFYLILTRPKNYLNN